MIRVPIRLDGEQLRLVQALSKLAGYSVPTVAAVLVTLGFLKYQTEVAIGLAAHRANKKRRTKARRRGR